MSQVPFGSCAMGSPVCLWGVCGLGSFDFLCLPSSLRASFVCFWWCVGGLGGVGVVLFMGFGGGFCAGCLFVGAWCGGCSCGAFLESLILAQDERWRRA